MKTGYAALWLAAFSLCSQAGADEIRLVKNAMIYPSNVMISSLLNSHDFSILTTAIKSVHLEQPLMKPGSYTLFAPDNAAFSTLPESVAERVFLHINRDEMAKLLACHLVINPPQAGRRLLDIVVEGVPLQIQTLGGCTLTLTKTNAHLTITDGTGQTSQITDADVMQSNGMLEMIDHVLLPVN
jgi:uncharacterized surface protein with fasciclin (FAS1) repeats